MHGTLLLKMRILGSQTQVFMQTHYQLSYPAALNVPWTETGDHMNGSIWFLLQAKINRIHAYNVLQWVTDIYFHATLKYCLLTLLLS